MQFHILTCVGLNLCLSNNVQEVPDDAGPEPYFEYQVFLYPIFFP
jgi:hypothetical protein